MKIAHLLVTTFAVLSSVLTPFAAQAQSDFTFTATVTAGGSPVNGAKVFISSDDPDGSAIFNQGTTNASGVATIVTQLPALNEAFNLIVSVFPTDSTSVQFAPANAKTFVPVNQNSANATIPVSAATENITVNLVNAVGAARPVQSGESMSVGCNGVLNGDNRVKAVTVGQSSATVLSVPGAAYECYLIADGIGSNRAQLTVQSGQVNTASITLTPTDREILVDVVDNNGVPITAVDFQITATGAGNLDFINQAFTRSGGDSKFHINVPNTPLKVSYQVTSSEAQILATNFIFLPTTASVTPASGTPSSVTLVVPQSTTTLTVTVTKAAGTVLTGATVTVFSETSGGTDTFGAISDTGTTNASGQVTFDMLPGRSARVNVVTLGGDRDPDGNGIFDESEPDPATVSIVAGSNSLTLAQVANDHTLTVSTQSTVTGLQRVRCSASNDTMVTPVIALAQNNSFNLKSSATDTYLIECNAILGTKSYGGTLLHLASAAGTGQVTVTLAEEGDYDAGDATFVNGSVNSEVPLDGAGCGQFTIPAKAADTQQIAVTAGDAVGVREDSEVDLHNAVNITARKSSDGTKLDVLSSECEVVICYDEADLPAGTTESQIGCAAQPEGSSTVEEVACTVDTTANKVTIKTNHLSVFGIDLPDGTAATPTPVPTATVVPSVTPTLTPVPVSAPTALKAKKAKKQAGSKVAFDLSWTAPTGAASYQYQVRKVNKKKDKGKTVEQLFANVAAKAVTAAKVTVKFKIGDYEYRVRALGTNGTAGSYSTTKKIKAK